MTRDPTIEELISSKDVLVMTAQSQNWDPNSDIYAQNKENMIDWEGNMIKPRHRTQIMIEDMPGVDDSIISSAVISASKSIMIYSTF